MLEDEYFTSPVSNCGLEIPEYFSSILKYSQEIPEYSPRLLKPWFAQQSLYPAGLFSFPWEQIRDVIDRFGFIAVKFFFEGKEPLVWKLVWSLLVGICYTADVLVVLATDDLFLPGVGCLH